MVITSYIATETYTRVAQYLLAGVGRRSGSSSAPCSGHAVAGPDLDIDLIFPDTHVGSARDSP